MTENDEVGGIDWSMSLQPSPDLKFHLEDLACQNTGCTNPTFLEDVDAANTGNRWVTRGDNNEVTDAKCACCDGNLSRIQHANPAVGLRGGSERTANPDALRAGVEKLRRGAVLIFADNTGPREIGVVLATIPEKDMALVSTVPVRGASNDGGTDNN